MTTPALDFKVNHLFFLSFYARINLFRAMFTSGTWLFPRLESVNWLRFPPLPINQLIATLCPRPPSYARVRHLLMRLMHGWMQEEWGRTAQNRGQAGRRRLIEAIVQSHPPSPRLYPPTQAREREGERERQIKSRWFRERYQLVSSSVRHPLRRPLGLGVTKGHVWVCGKSRHK